MKRNLKSIIGTCFQGCVTSSYGNLVKKLGEPKERFGDYKSDVEWEVQTPYGVATVYNWKDGKSYLGEEGMDVVEITDWNIGAHNRESAEYVRSLISNPNSFYKFS